MDDRVLRSLGRVTVKFQALEMTFCFLAQALVDPDPAIGQIVTSQLSFQKLCDVCLALFRRRVEDTELVDELEGLVKRAASAEQERNKYIHSRWMIMATDDDTRPIGRLKTGLRKRELVLDSEEISADGKELEDLATAMSGIAYDVMKLMIAARERGLIDFPYAVRRENGNFDRA